MGCGSSTAGGGLSPAPNTSDFEWDPDGSDAPSDAPPSAPPPASAMRRKRASVSAECYTPGQQSVSPVKSVSKSPSELSEIQGLISNNILFKSLDREQLGTVVGAFERQFFAEGAEIITQGDRVADWYYVVSEGGAEALVDGVKVKEYGVGGAFGELALLYNAPRAATVVSSANLTAWALDRNTFRAIVVDSNASRRRDYELFLSQVPLLSELDDTERSCVADVLEPFYFNQGEEIITEGRTGEDFIFLLEDGTAEGFASAAPEKRMQYKRGDYFGELSLLTDKPRKATVVATSEQVKVARIDSAAFRRLLGRMEDILKRNADKYEQFMRDI